MTVTYTNQVATCRGFGCFVKLLFRWHGSIYKLVWPDLFLFLGTYFSLSVLYRFFMSPSQQKIFEQISVYCDQYGTLIPVSFVLGFYVSIVVARWWDQYKEEKGRLMRRTVMRYCCLSLTMCFTLISPRVKKRFPTLNHFIEAGLLLENEKKVIEDLNIAVPGYSKTWLPIVWAASIVTRARKEGKIRDDFAVKTLLDELNKFRGLCGMLISYDWISVPLVYTQVVTLAVYSYFLSCVMARQWLSPDHPEAATKNKVVDLDLVFPIFTTLQFFFYMGWLKVAESLLNPFGDDDDDFELNWIVDRNLQVSYLIVDEIHHQHPELLKDQYWDAVFPSELPYTIGSEQYRDIPPVHSTAKIQVSKNDAEIVPPSFKLDEMNESEEVGRRSGSESPGPGRTTTGNTGRGNRERTFSVRSNTSQSTLADNTASGKMSRAGSISSVLKRMFSRDRESGLGSSAMFGGSVTNSLCISVDGRVGVGEASGSQINLNRNLLQDVIPELDENATTIVSMRDEKRPPTVQEIFGMSPPDSNTCYWTNPTYTTTTDASLPGVGGRNCDESNSEEEPSTTTTLNNVKVATGPSPSSSSIHLGRARTAAPVGLMASQSCPNANDTKVQLVSHDDDDNQLKLSTPIVTDTPSKRKTHISISSPSLISDNQTQIHRRLSNDLSSALVAHDIVPRSVSVFSFDTREENQLSKIFLLNQSDSDDDDSFPDDESQAQLQSQQQQQRFSQSKDTISKRIAKKFGFMDKDQGNANGAADSSVEQHLLDEMDTSKQD